MTVAELRKALEGVPGDTKVVHDHGSPSERFMAGLLRYHYAGGTTEDFVVIEWAGMDGYRWHLGKDIESSGYHPTVLRILHKDPLR